MTDRLDIIIFGASGYTGKCVALEITKLLPKLTWGIAGRNQEKLEAVLSEIGVKTKTDHFKIPIIIADINNEQSVKAMAARCKVVVNCSGPFIIYGEAVVKACIEAGTHYVDISGETSFIERMQLEYHVLATEKGVYIICSCGFGFLTFDLGTLFLETHFEGEVNSIEMYLKVWVEDGIKSGSWLNSGTWNSFIYAQSHVKRIKEIRSKLFKEDLPVLEPKLSDRAVHKSSVLSNKWCIPFSREDNGVVERSQRFFYENEKKRPVQFQSYIVMRSFYYTILSIITGLFLSLLGQFSFGIKLLLNYPKLFSFGFFSNEGPTEETINNSRFSLIFHGSGWHKEESLIEPTDQHTTLPSKTIVTKISGTNPAYGATCVTLLLSAKTILTEFDKMPGTGGVLTPGAAFAKTKLINEMSMNGFTFEVITAKEATKDV